MRGPGAPWRRRSGSGGTSDASWGVVRATLVCSATSSQSGRRGFPLQGGGGNSRKGPHVGGGHGRPGHGRRSELIEKNAMTLLLRFRDKH